MAGDESTGAAIEMFGRWLPLVTSLAAAVLSTPLSPVKVAQVLGALVDAVQGSDSKVLESISAVRNEPFQTGIEALRDAARVGRDDPLWETFIGRAENELSRAASMLARTDWRGKAEVQLNLALVYHAKGRPGEAAERLGRSTHHADEALKAYLQAPWWDYFRLNGPKRGESWVPLVEDLRLGAAPAPQARRVRSQRYVGGLVSAFAIGLTMGVGKPPLEAYEKRLDRRFGRELADFLSFYNANEYVASAFTGRPAKYVGLREMPAVLAGDVRRTKYLLLPAAAPPLPSARG